MPVDLYEALGASPTGDAEHIKKAWKCTMKRVHPDQGGTREAFDQAQTALRVLTDPVRRERYDRTGKYDTEPEVDNETAAVRSLLADCIAAVIFGTSSDENLTRVDMVAGLREILAQPRHEASKTLATNKRARARAEKLRGRFKGQDGTPDALVDRMLDFRVEQMDEQDEKCTALLARCDKVEEILASMTFEQDAEPAWGYTNIGLGIYQAVRY